MKKLNKLMMAAGALGIAAGLFTGCNTAAQGNANAEKQKSLTIGISQFAEHSSLDNCRIGFIEGLKQEGFIEGENVTLLLDNAQADPGVASSIAESQVMKKVDLICAIATPSAMTAYNSCLNTTIPVVYSAISDPVAAGLADEAGKSVGNITGTSDELPVEEQLQLIRRMLPDAKSIGILYTTSEANSISTIEIYKQLAPKYGFEIIDSAVSAVSEVSLAAPSLAAKVDCISNLTDNTVVTALQTLLDAANKENIPVFGSEVEQVKSGCLAAAGIDYVELGIQTGKMAAKVLKGEAKAEDIPFEKLTKAGIYVNKAAAENLGLTVEQTLLDEADETFDAIAG